MALNYSQCLIFPADTLEDNMVSPLRIVNGRNNGEIYDGFGYRRENVNKGGLPDPVSAYIIDLLPSDPFGMDIDISTTFTAITRWLESEHKSNRQPDYALLRHTMVIHDDKALGQS